MTKCTRILTYHKALKKQNIQKDLFIDKRDGNKVIMNVFPHGPKPMCGKSSTKQSVIKSTT